MVPCSTQREYQPKANTHHLKQFGFCRLGSPLKTNYFVINTILTQLKNQSITPYFVKSFEDIKEYPTNFKPHIKST